MRTKILVAESRDFSPDAVRILRQAGELTMADLDREGLLRSVPEMDVLWVRLGHCVDAEVLNAARQLETIVTPTTGLGHIDLAEARRRGIDVISLQGESEFLENVRATAEHTIGLILSLLRKLPAASAHAKRGGWQRDPFRGREIYGKTVGIVGYGRLGRIVARYLKAFDAHVVASVKPGDQPFPDAGVSVVPLDALLRASDIVTLHVNLCEETAGFFGRREFARMKPGAWFINTARGELIDEDALLQALASQRLSGAALDVLRDESPAGMLERPLVAYARTHENLLLTPHIGGCTHESTTKTEVFLAQKLLERRLQMAARSA